MKERTTLEKAVWYLFLLLVFSMGSMKPYTILFNQRLTPTDLIFPFVAISLLAALLSRAIRMKLDRTVIAVMLFVAALAVSAVFSENPPISVRKMAGVIYLAGIALATYHIVDSDDRIRAVVFAYLIGAAIPVVIGLTTLLLYYIAPGSAFVQEFTYHFGAVPVGNYPRLSSTFVSASMFLNYLSVALVMLIVGRLRYSMPAVIFYSLMAAVIICSVFTISIGLGAIFLILGTWFWTSSAERPTALRRFGLAGGIATAAFFLLLVPIALQPHPTADPVFSLWYLGIEIYPSGRLLVWLQAINTFLSQPVTGIGIGMPSASVLFQNTDGSMSMLTDAHSVFLSIASQAGIIGVLALIYLCYRTLASNWKHIDGALNTPVAAWLGIAFAIGFIYQGMTGSFEDARHLWLLIGLIPAAASIETEQD